ncbi:MAG: hypothetical protein AB7F20_15725 [Geoalkalibacter sp.]|uniref:hypothetical protein n=1 Tax=Geoalkalibacter sp. TaxID=3041440 RepID=UPI003D14E02A
MLKDLVQQTRNSGIRADYLLFDSWFAFPATIIGLLEEQQQVICMLKEAKTKYGTGLIPAPDATSGLYFLKLQRGFKLLRRSSRCER